MSDTILTLCGMPVHVCGTAGPRLDGERAATDIVGDMLGSGAQLAVVPVSRLGDGFLTLSTRIAGGVIQKFVNYGLRVAFVGDVSAAVAASDALRDFIRESNRGRHIWFVADLAELEAKLAVQG
jgi:hypothetical protein